MLGRVAVLLALCALASAGATLDTPESGLRQIIVLSRHGVRGPYGLGTESPSADLLRQYVRNPDMDLPLSANAWGTSETGDPTEIVSPKLTKHGFQVVKRMGEYFRDHLYEEFLNATCEETFAYADNNQRDNLTAIAFLSGLYPSCKDLVPITEETQLLFEQGQDPTADCPVCSKAVYEGITGSNDTRFVLQEIREEVTEVNELLQCCAESVCNVDEQFDSVADSESAEKCDLFGIPTQWNGAFYLPWKDTLSNTDYFSEWLLLQSLNNMSLPSALTFEKILSLAKIHETHMDLITNEVNSASFGATLLAHLTASFEQNIRQKPLPVAKGEGPRILQGPDNRLLYYAAHDINLLYVRNLLRLQWYSKGWHPHQPVPGSMLVFELHATPPAEDGDGAAESRHLLKTAGTGNAHVSWRVGGPGEAISNAESQFYVKLFFVAASPDQIRDGDELSPENPPDRVQVIIPSCSEEVDIGDGATDVRCPFSTFKKLIGKTLKHVCVADTLRPFVDSLSHGKEYAENSTLTTTIMMDVARDTEVSTSDRSKRPRVVGAFETLLWSLFGILILCFIVLLIRHLVKRWMEQQKYGSIPTQTNNH